MEPSPLHYRSSGGEIVPRFFDAADHPWLRSLLFEYERFVGRRRRELRKRLREPMPFACPGWKVALAARVLDGLWVDRTRAAVPPVHARAELFGEAVRGGTTDAVLVRAATRLDTTPDALRESLFADLPDERRVARPEEPVSPTELALRVNLALAQSLVRRATVVRIGVTGRARALVRHAKLRGLLCTVRPKPGPERALLEVSGPFALFRRTLVYGRALAGLIPRLAWCHRFVLHADCLLGDEPKRLVLRSGDPIFPAAEPREFDSKVEARFARDFARAAPEWDIVREPEPVEADGTLVFPDFALVRRSNPDDRWLLEVVGFWTPDYLERKLRSLRAAGLPNLLLCIDEDRNCSEADLPPRTPVVRYRRRIDPAAVLRVIEGPRRPAR